MPTREHSQRFLFVMQALKAVIGAEACAPLRQAILDKLSNRSYTIRQAAIGALVGLVGSDSAVQQAILHRVTDADDDVRQAAVGALAGEVNSDAAVRQAILNKLTVSNDGMRRAAIKALAGLAGSDAEVRQAILSKLNDTSDDVRQAAAEALVELVISEAAVRKVILNKLNDANAAIRQTILRTLAKGASNVRQAAVEALAGLVSSDVAVRQAILDKLANEWYSVRQAAVEALAGLVANDTAVRQALLDRLTDERYGVRLMAVKALAALIGSDDVVTQTLLPWIGAVGESPFSTVSAQEIRCLLATAYAPLLAEHPPLFSEVFRMLTSPAWPARQGAALAFISMPGGPPPHIHSTLLNMPNYTYDEEGWPERLRVCETLLNGRDHDLSQRAITLTLEALDYATQPWYSLSDADAQIRRDAWRILGQLEPLYRDERIFARLVRVLHEDADANVRDAAYGTLLHLAAAPEEVSQERETHMDV